MSVRAIALVLILALVPFRTWAREGISAGSQTLYLLLLSFGKGDEVVLNHLRSSLSETDGVRVGDDAGGADFIGKVEIARGNGSRTITVTVLKRGGDVLYRTRQTVWPGDNLAGVTDAMAQSIAKAIRNDSGVDAEPPPAARNQRESATTSSEASLPRTTQPSDEPERLERSRRRRGDTPDPRHSRLAFVFGLELGGGPWLANSTDIVRGSPKGFDFSHYGPAFTRGLDGIWHPALDLHGGWRFFNAAAVEVAVQSGVWGNDGLGAGGAILVGGRLIGYPLQLIDRDRKYDVGVEAGIGYAFVGGPYYNMSGKYFSLGVTGEYDIKPWLSIQASYRLLMPVLSTFYVDYANDFTEPVDGFVAYWHTFNVGVAFHIGTNL